LARAEKGLFPAQEWYGREDIAAPEEVEAVKTGTVTKHESRKAWARLLVEKAIGIHTFRKIIFTPLWKIISTVPKRLLPPSLPEIYRIHLPG
jgi:hypothetical protein